MKKRIISFVLVFVLILSLGVTASADNIQSRAVIGADLTPEQVALVYQAFGVQQGSVIQLNITNAEERAYLEGYVDSSIIGTRSISCVYVELLGSGAGMNVTTSNITWCTPEMYISALATAGITDAPEADAPKEDGAPKDE